MARRPCLDCGALTTGTRCVPCRGARSRERDRHRGSSTARGYNYTHRRLRAQVLAGDPPCHWCGTAPATVADHLVPLALGGTNTLDNYVPSCVSCNSARQANSEWTPPQHPH